MDLESMLAKMCPKIPRATTKRATEPQDKPNVALSANQAYPFDPIKRASEIESLVMQGDKRKYFRFRYDPQWFAPCIADSCGCCLECGYCWNHAKNRDLPGSLKSPSEVADKLNEMGKKYNAGNYRAGGCEPFLGEASVKHLAKVISLSDCENFLIETNAVILGQNLQWLEYLKPHRDVINFRVAAKGDSPENFQLITGADGKYFDSSFNAIWKALLMGFKCKMAYLGDFTDGEKLMEVSEWPGPYDCEKLRFYPGTKERLIKRGIWDIKIK
jgi:uncharacterized Fe-S cluster-containing radical SAM superfamily protein